MLISLLGLKNGKEITLSVICGRLVENAKHMAHLIFI